MYGDIGQKSNTMIFSERPADVNALLAQAAAVFGNKIDSASSKSGSILPPPAPK
jgi:hypothetical protein